MKKSLSVLISLCGLRLLAGCGAGSPPPPPPVATHLSVFAPATVTAGAAFNVTVTALDASNNVVPSYSGTVRLSSSDTQAVLPAPSGLSNGTGTFSVIFKAATGQSITATDTVNASIMGTSNGINVSGGPATRLSVSAPSAATAGMAFAFSVNAFDAFNNVASYSGTVHFTSTDAQAKLPPDSGIVTSFPATLNTIASATTITATDTVTASLTASSNPISVFSNAATHFTVATPGTATTRATFSVAVTALDGANNISIGYSGTVHFTSTDSNAILPANSTLTIGAQTFSATLETAGSQMITATDTVTTSLTGTSIAIGVTASAALTITSGAPPQGTVSVNYGPFSTQEFRCVRIFPGFFLNCTPCSSLSACASLPLCGTFSASPCRETRQVFAGFAFTATGGIRPYSWSASGMPPGLSVNSANGEIIGTPTLAGTYNVAVTLADSGKPPSPVNANFTIVIKNPPPPVINTTPAPPAGAINLPYSFTFTATGGLSPLGPWSESGALIPGFGAVSNAGVLSGTPTATGSFPITVMVQDAAGQNSAPQVFTIEIFAHGFKATGSMATSRVAHTATLLNTGKVLVAGGTDANGSPVATAELYDPSTGSFSSTGSMATARAHFAATLLSSGKVLVTGGLDAAGNPLSTAEVYDPSAGTFSATSGSMTIARASHTATLLNTGKVLVAGWGGGGTAELFDPATGTFAATGSMATARVSHTATLLNTGKVLVAGGIQGTGTATTVLAEGELYDPATGTFAATGSMATARNNHTATLLSTGKVLVTGGTGTTGSAIATAELFDPTTQSFTPTTGSMGTARAQHTATLLKDGTVLVTGGDPPGAVVLATAELYDPSSQTFTPTGSMGTARSSHTATLLGSGTVLVTGGTNGAALATAELYQ